MYFTNKSRLCVPLTIDVNFLASFLSFFLTLPYTIHSLFYVIFSAFANLDSLLTEDWQSIFGVVYNQSILFFCCLNIPRAGIEEKGFTLK